MKLALILIVGAFSIGFCWDKHPLKNKKHPLCGHFVLLWFSYTNSNCYVGETNGK
jgi:hypothetical protein